MRSRCGAPLAVRGAGSGRGVRVWRTVGFVGWVGVLAAGWVRAGRRRCAGGEVACRRGLRVLGSPDVVARCGRYPDVGVDVRTVPERRDSRDGSVDEHRNEPMTGYPDIPDDSEWVTHTEDERATVLRANDEEVSFQWETDSLELVPRSTFLSHFTPTDKAPPPKPSVMDDVDIPDGSEWVDKVTGDRRTVRETDHTYVCCRHVDLDKLTFWTRSDFLTHHIPADQAPPPKPTPVERWAIVPDDGEWWSDPNKASAKRGAGVRGRWIAPVVPDMDRAEWVPATL